MTSIHARMLSEAALIPQVGQHLVDSGGKRLRPAHHPGLGPAVRAIAGDAHVKLCRRRRVHPHPRPLLHDDVVDESALRRGRPAANLLWGNKPSILVGDFLFSRAFQLMVEVGSPAVLGVSGKCVRPSSPRGEVLQLRSAKKSGDQRSTISPRHHRQRTAALFFGGCRGRARWRRGAEPAQWQAMREYGRNLGIFVSAGGRRASIIPADRRSWENPWATISANPR